MARQVLPWVGAIVGAFVGSPQVGFMIGSLIGNAVDPQVIKGPSIGDGQTQTSNEGVPRPIIYGTACVAGNVIDKSPIYKSIKETQQSKGGGPISEEERLHLTYAIRICEGPVSGILRIWEDEKLVYDVRSVGSQVSAEENNKYLRNFRFYNGDENQLPDPELEVVHGVGNTPSYRGTAYIVFPRYDVTDRRGAIPNYRFEIASIAKETEFPAVITNNTVFTGIPERLEPSSEISWSGFGFNVTNYQARDVHRDGSYTCAIAQQIGQSVNKNVCLVQKKNDEQKFEPRLAIVHEQNLNVSDAIFSSDGKFLFVFFNPISSTDYETKSQWRTYRVDNDSFEILYSGELPDYIRIKANSLGISKTDNKMVAGANRVQQGSGGTRYLVFTVNNGLIFSPQIINLNQDEALTFPDFSPNQRHVVCSGSNYTTVFDVINLEMTHLFYTGSSSGGACFGPSGLRVFIFTQTGGCYACSFNMTTGIIFDAQYFNLTVPGNLISNQFGGSVNESRDFFVTGRFGGGASGNSIGWVYKLTEEPKNIELVSSLISNVQTSFVSRSIFEKRETSNFVDGVTDRVGSIILDIADRCKIDSVLINVSEVRDILVRGFVIAQQYAGNNAIRSLQNAFFFDPGQWDGQINFIPRGKNSLVTITEDDLTEDPFEATRKSSIEYPRKIELLYQNATIGYDRAKEEAFRNSPSVRVSGSQTIEVPVVFNETEAARTAEKQIKVAWAEAEGELPFHVPTSFDYLTPTDTIGVLVNGSLRRVRIEKIERADGILKLTTKVDRQSAYTSKVEALPLPPPTPPPPTITGRTEFMFLNIPALLDNHDILGYYVAATGSTEAWYGAVIERRVEDEEFGTITTVQSRSTMGFLTQPLNAASEHYTDATNTIHVQLYSGDFYSVTREQLLRENNAVAIGREDGTAEILQFQDAEDMGNGIYKLTNLIRGRLNSGATGHIENSKIVLLDNAKLVSTTSDLISMNLTHRATSYGESPETSEEYTNKYQPVMMQLEFPVDQLKAVKNGANIDVSWSPRERFGTDINPIRSVNWQYYLVTITQSGATLTQETLFPSLSFDASAMSGNIQISVQQVNRITGPGPAQTIIIEA